MLGTLALAGIGCALMSNPRRRKRKLKTHSVSKRKSRRSAFGRWTVLRKGQTRSAVSMSKGTAIRMLARMKRVYPKSTRGARIALVSNPTKRRRTTKRKVRLSKGWARMVRRMRTPAARRASVKRWARSVKAHLAKKRNPAKRRRTTKRASKRTSPAFAASRLAHWRWHHNPKPRDLTEHEFTRGKAHVTIAMWRNANATAFVAVTARGPGGVKTWEAKSQGPSSGGYSKPQQALERVYFNMTKTASQGSYPSTQGSALLSEIADIAAAKVGGTSTNPHRRKGRRNPRVAKTKKVYVIQGNYGYGWDDEAEEDTWKEAREQLKTYRANGGGSYRCITRREKLQANPGAHGQEDSREYGQRRANETGRRYFMTGMGHVMLDVQQNRGSKDHQKAMGGIVQVFKPQRTNPRRRSKRRAR